MSFVMTDEFSVKVTKVTIDNFSMRGYLPLTRKDSSTHMHGLPVYVKEGLRFARDLSLGNQAGSDLCFRLALLHSVFCFFSSFIFVHGF